jgi:uncharacterized protein YjbI with pentapeptide repeats
MPNVEEHRSWRRVWGWIRHHPGWIAAGASYLLVWWLVPFALYRRTGTPKTNELEAITTTRTALLAGLIGVGALLTFWLNRKLYEVATKTLKVTEQGQITERFTKATEQLGSDKLDVRLGGIYGLERIAKDSEEDQPSVVEVLSAFVREHSQPQTTAREPAIVEVLAALLQGRNESVGAHQLDPDRSTENKPKESSSLPKPTIDVQAALTVLGRLPELPNVSRGDLTGANLAGANLVEMNLAGADLAKVNLADAFLAKVNLAGGNLTEANLAGGNLAEANLAGADLAEADLAEAKLIRADLAKAKLGKANLSSADLTRANLVHAGLKEADLPGADLTGADLTNAHLSSANLAGAKILGANLEGADLVDANLSNASFFVKTPEGAVSFSKRSPANLTRTWLLGTNLSGVNLVGLDLSETIDLTQEQLALAHGNGNIPLPEEVRRPDSWIAEPESTGASVAEP